MNNSPLSLPDQKNYEYSMGIALDVAREKLAQIADIQGQCLKCGASYQRSDFTDVITLSYFTRSCRITLPDASTVFTDTGDEVPLREKLLVLHYLITAKGTPLSQKVISFKELAGLKSYFRTFRKRAIEPLINAFGREPHLLLEAALNFDAVKSDYGDIAVTIKAFDRVSVTYVLWQGDDEFPPDGNVMYDSTISDYLPSEDIIVLSEILAWKLVKYARS